MKGLYLKVLLGHKGSLLASGRLLIVTPEVLVEVQVERGRSDLEIVVLGPPHVVVLHWLLLLLRLAYLKLRYVKLWSIKLLLLHLVLVVHPIILHERLIKLLLRLLKVVVVPLILLLLWLLHAPSRSVLLLLHALVEVDLLRGRDTYLELIVVRGPRVVVVVHLLLRINNCYKGGITCC